MLCGCENFCIALIFLGSGASPSFETLCPRKEMLRLPNEHFASLLWDLHLEFFGELLRAKPNVRKKFSEKRPKNRQCITNKIFAYYHQKLCLSIYRILLVHWSVKTHAVKLELSVFESWCSMRHKSCSWEIILCYWDVMVSGKQIHV